MLINGFASAIGVLSFPKEFGLPRRKSSAICLSIITGNKNTCKEKIKFPIVRQNKYIPIEELPLEVKDAKIYGRR